MGHELLNQRARICAEHGIPFNAVVADALERARVVGVLDAHPTERGWEVYPHGKGWRCGLGIAKQFDGPTPDAARAAAAKAIEAGGV